MVSTVILITGGFVIDAGPLYLSAHRLAPPLLLAFVSYVLAVRAGRQSVEAADAALWRFTDTHAAAIAVVLAAVAAAVGIGFGSYVAGGADSAAYINQARLIAQGDLVEAVPLASRVPWPSPEWTLAPLGSRPGLHAGEIVPTYPPGLPLVMAIASLVTGEIGPFLVGPFFAALCVLSTYWVAARLHSRTAGIISASLMTTSPVLLSQVIQPMSDIPSTALWTLALLAALSTRPFVAGAVSGLAILVRPSLFLVAASVGFVLVAWSVRRPASAHAVAARLSKFAIAATPGVAALAWIQWRLYGHPLASGHGAFAELFSATNILPNIRDYAMRILTGETPALLLIAVSAGLLAVRREPSKPVAFPLKLTAVIALPVLTCYLAYGVFPDWAYIRFLLPIWPVALAAAGALVVNASLRLPATVRTQVLVVALTAVCARNVVTARNEGSFTAWIEIKRYATAGRYLDAALPKAIVIVTSQHSASAHYYTGRPILRWDSLTADLDESVATLARLGWPSVFVIEEWEEPALRRKFPASALARLDWPASADFGYPTRVRLFNPADRERPTGRPPDRLP